MDFLEELRERKLVFDLSDEEKFLFALRNKKKIYLGIDPTAPSLHLGNYLGITLLKRFIKAGYEVVVLLGEMTSAIGDPSFRVNERVSLSSEKIKENLKSIEREVKYLLPEAEIINNYSFYEQLSILNFVKEMCSCINVNHLLAKEFLKDRLNKGITLAEFVYPLFQSWDFLVLYSMKDVAVQLGGSDQWGNITVGIDLIRKKVGSNHIASGLTFPLLLDSSGKKFGKSENNALFLNKELTSPYSIYQYLLNLDDSLVPNLLKQLTFLELKEIEKLKGVIVMKNTLAFEICKDIYGIRIAKKMESISSKLFSGKLEEDFDLIKGAIPTIEVTEAITFAQALRALGLVSSNSEINRLVSSKGLFLFEEVVTTSDLVLTSESSNKGYFLLRKGKKNYALVHFTCWK
ncbi:tyrosine--tRNA ligase [Candidatus Mycoplasma haematobovis]|uniref:Tyrosine--tRNA ligase n=1 Tax=Candidatus Mycoplasma haematobovis TaxID=432608 RepID=A0A1A9QCU0_9MOLU|nr:tyrosine--tRNA ligase [Candidatus Mycoplasma haematobovis]OAL10287.1 tyrosine--tRNA ligase [Candidatus Mycoplasma haematobovis]